MTITPPEPQPVQQAAVSTPTAPASNPEPFIGGSVDVTPSGSVIWTGAFWKGAGERMLKTFIQTFIPLEVAGLGAADATNFDVFGAPWVTATVAAAGLALGSTFLSLCTSIGNADFTAGK